MKESMKESRFQHIYDLTMNYFILLLDFCCAFTCGGMFRLNLKGQFKPKSNVRFKKLKNAALSKKSQQSCAKVSNHLQPDSNGLPEFFFGHWLLSPAFALRPLCVTTCRKCFFFLFVCLFVKSPNTDL